MFEKNTRKFNSDSPVRITFLIFFIFMDFYLKIIAICLPFPPAKCATDSVSM